MYAPVGPVLLLVPAFLGAVCALLALLTWLDRAPDASDRARRTVTPPRSLAAPRHRRARAAKFSRHAA
jgi:hypothetical protein